MLLDEGQKIVYLYCTSLCMCIAYAMYTVIEIYNFCLLCNKVRKDIQLELSYYTAFYIMYV